MWTQSPSQPPITHLSHPLLSLPFPCQSFIACARSNSGDLFRKPAPGLWHLLVRQWELRQQQVDLGGSVNTCHFLSSA